LLGFKQTDLSLWAQQLVQILIVKIWTQTRQHTQRKIPMRASSLVETSKDITERMQ
jgi:hypothetical protein